MRNQSSLLIDESPLQVIPSLAVAIGLNEAIMLQQIHYWQRISPLEQDGRRWVAMSAPDLVDKFPFWSEKTIKRTVASLREKALLIVTKKSTTSWERGNWYTVEYEAMNRLGSASGQNDPMHRAILALSIGPKWPDRSGQNDPMSYKGKSKPRDKAQSAWIRPDWVPLESWDGYEAMRIKIRKPMTDRARKLIEVKLADLKAAGHEPSKVLDQSVEHSWAGVFPVKQQTAQQGGYAEGWWSTDQGMLKKAQELGVSTNGLSSYQLRAKINEKIATGKAH